MTDGQQLPFSEVTYGQACVGWIQFGVRIIFLFIGFLWIALLLCVMVAVILT